MEFIFTKNLPPSEGRNYINSAHAQEVVDACLDNAGEWAQVPYTYLYPDAEGLEKKKLIGRCQNVAGRIQRGELAPFNEYNTEAKARGADLYIRILLSARDRRALEDF